VGRLDGAAIIGAAKQPSQREAHPASNRFALAPSPPAGPSRPGMKRPCLPLESFRHTCPGSSPITSPVRPARFADRRTQDDIYIV